VPEEGGPGAGGRAFVPPALTAAGRSALGASLVSWAVGFGLGYVELLVVAASGLVAVALALGWTAVRPRLDVDRTVWPERVVRGEPAEAALRITNPTGRSLPRLTALDRVGARQVEVDLPRVPAGGTGELSYSLPTDRRGIVPVGPLNVVREDPLGLLRAARRFGEAGALWVYPRIYPVLPLSAGAKRDLEGPTSDGAAGSITFHALREYVLGDDLRLVHWRSTARTGTLMIRQQADPSQPQTTVVLDTHRGSYDEDTFEAAIEAAASLVAASTRYKFPVKLHTGTGLAVTGRGGRSTASALLDHLTPLEWSDRGTLADVATRVASESTGHGLVVVTGNPDPPDLLAMEALRPRFDTMAVVRFRRDVDPGASSERGVIDMVAPDGPAFASLWAQRTS
jgi:uncharacterized protein (DUF58 family)